MFLYVEVSLVVKPRVVIPLSRVRFSYVDPTIYPVSSIVEHSTDNRKTEERYLYWIPAAFVDMVITLV